MLPFIPNGTKNLVISTDWGDFARYLELNSYKKMEWDKKALDALFLR